MKSSGFTRSTAECSFSEFPPVFIRSVKTFEEMYHVGDLESEVLGCFLTTNHKKGFLGKVTTSQTVICMTKRFLLWGIYKDEKDEGVAAAQWSEVSDIWDWETSEGGQLFEDHGVEVFGFQCLNSRRSRAFIGLGNDEAGSRCRTLMKEMIKK